MLDAPARPHLTGGERQRAEHDVGVSVLGVGVGMVPAVLAGPPADAESDAQIAAQDADDVVGPPGAEDLLVPGVMADEADLGEDHRQEHGGAQLPPRVRENGEHGPSGRQRQPGQRDLPGVVTWPPVQQSRLPHPRQQHRVLTAARAGGLNLPGIRDTPAPPGTPSGYRESGVVRITRWHRPDEPGDR